MGVWEGAAGACGRTQAGSCHSQNFETRCREQSCPFPPLPVSPVLLFDSVDVSRDVVP